MTKDNASGAGMETVCHLYASDEDALKKSGACTVYELEQQFCFLPDERFAELVRRTDATRLLAESQAHNAKLEAQVERMREALQANYQAMCAADRYASNCDLDDDPYIDTQMHTDCVKAGELARAALKP